MYLELVLLFTICILLRLYIKGSYDRFGDAGVPYSKPEPYLVFFYKMVTKKAHLLGTLQKIYDEVGDESCRYVGALSFHASAMMVKDLELIKQITVKDFDYFSEHKNGFGGDSDPVLGRSLISLKGQRWRDMRSALSPAFTSSKIRDMIPFVTECGEQMTDYLNELCDENLLINGEAYAEIEGKDLSARYMNDVIASTAFGTRVNSFKDKDNAFFLMGQSLTTFGVSFIIKMMLIMLAPKLCKFFGVGLFDDKMNKFFRELVLNSMRYRKEKGIIRRDMIQLLMELKQGSLQHDNIGNYENDSGFATVEESDIGKKGVKKSWTDDDLVGQAILFFLGGYETASTLTSFLLHELAVNPEIQEKLKREVDDFVRKHGTNIRHDTLQGLTYMDMFVSEGLRKWPPSILSDRACVKNIDLGPVRKDEKTSYTFKVGEMICIPTYSIHHDPRYWQDPSRFDPERFSDENKHKILPFSYLPFGSGPRNCIGSRFALMEVKIMMLHIISKFEIKESSKTKNPLILDRTKFTLHAKGGFWVKFVKRST